MTASFTYTEDYTPLNIVRLLTNDKYEDTPIFYDHEINFFLALESNDTRKAAAKALETIAADEVLVQKVIKLLSLSTDGAKVAAELRANAKALRDQANEDTSGDGLFDIAEWVVDDATARQRLVNEALRVNEL
jgi:hypothetical protein